MDEIVKALKALLHCPVQADEKTLDRYATDQSIYRVRPMAVVFPQGVEDVVTTVRFARDAGIPLTPRAGGSGTAGAGLGRGILLAFDRAGPMNRIFSFVARVEPGLVHDDLQHYLRQRGLYLPSDPSSGAISLLGGNIATKASGPHALKHGSIDRYLHAVQFVTVDGEVVDTIDETSIPGRLRGDVAGLGLFPGGL